MVTLGIALGGCVEPSMVAETRWEIENGLPGASFEREHAFRLGRVSMSMVKPIALWALKDSEEEQQMIRSIRRVDLAVYEVLSFPAVVEAKQLRGLEEKLGRKGWVPMVRTKEDNEITWVFSRENRAGEIKDLFVVSVDGSEVVMVRVGGRLDKVMAELIAADPGGFGASLGG